MLEDTYGHSPIKRMFRKGDVYGVGYDAKRAARKPLKLGIIGCGGVAVSKYLPAVMRLQAIWEPIEITAICRTAEREGRHIARLYGCRWYADYRHLLADEELDGVMVLGPDARHVEHGLACLDRGRPVLVEKPIARSLADARRLCQHADRRRVPLMVVANKRYSPPYRRARQFIVNGPVKNPGLCCGKFNLGYDYVDLLEQGTIHLFDITRYLMGNVKTVTAIGVNKYHRNRWYYPVDHAVISLEFTSGAVGTLSTVATALSLKPWERMEVYANKAWLAVEDQCELILYDSEQGPAKSWKPVWPNTLLFDEEFAGFMGLVENFAQVIRGQEKPLVTGWDGYAAYEINVAAHLSLARREKVRLPLDPIAADKELRRILRK